MKMPFSGEWPVVPRDAGFQRRHMLVESVMFEMRDVMSRWLAAVRRRLTMLVVSLALLGAATSSEARLPPSQDPFYQYDGSAPLEDILPGTVLKSRSVPYHLIGFPLPIKTTQLLYRSTGQLGQATVNVTSVVQPAFNLGPKKVVSYQSAYDSLNPDDEPSYAISGGLTLGGLIPNIEAVLIIPLLSKGYTVVVPDIQGQQANLVAGQEYGMNTLDSLRAAFASPAIGLSSDTEVALIGYSGGAVAAEWAAELASGYAPDMDKRIIGTSIGGVFAHPVNNLHYIDGSQQWSGVMVMAFIGLARAYEIDLEPYLNDYGKSLYERIHEASILSVLNRYPGLTWASITKPEYQTPEQIPELVEALNDTIMGTGGTPSAPLQIRQGAGGESEGTPGNKPGIGPGDGIMVAGDVRSLAREYCSRGAKVQYGQSESLGHTLTALVWIAEMLPWVDGRFAGHTASQNCLQIPPGNPRDPIPSL